MRAHIVGANACGDSQKKNTYFCYNIIMKNKLEKNKNINNVISTRHFLSFILAFILLITLFSNVLYAEDVIDKKGKVIYETIRPTAETTENPDKISDAVRYVPREKIDYTAKEYTGPEKNIFSKDTIYTAINPDDVPKTEYTIIRHTASITDVDEDRYELTNDTKKDRMRLRIIVANTGEFEAKNGFYKVNGKVYYFDEDGLMVLGPAYDTIGNYYFFSYETGELIEEKLVR